MIPLPNLNDQNFADIVAQSIKKIDTYTSNWNDHDLHDPGIMLIELFSYLKERQQEKINKVGEKSFYKFLDLLDMSFEKAKPATANVAFTSDTQITLPNGTKFQFMDIVFETVKRVEILDNEIIGISEPYVFGNPSREGNTFQIYFNKPLPSGLTINMYIDILEDYIVKRNPVTSPGEFIPTSKIIWEYYGEKNCVKGWHPLEIKTDETYNLLFSGSFSFCVDAVHLESEDKYPIRGTLSTDLYEVPPKIKHILLNSTSLVQHDTKCITFLFSFKEFSINKMLLDCYLAYNGAYDLYIKSESGWQKAEDLEIMYMLKEESGFFRFATSKRSLLFSHFKNMKEQDIVFKLVIYDKEFYSKKVAGIGNGFANQLLRLNFDVVCTQELELMVSSKQNIWNEFKLVANLDNSKPNDRHYVFFDKEQTIMFGNNEYGKTPFPGSEIIITNLKTTFGAHGNIAEGKLTKPLNQEIFPSLSVRQHQSAAGGMDMESIEDVVIRIPKTLNDIQKAVTKLDYEIIAKNTQGLLLENVAALPLYKPKADGRADNTVTVVVEPLCVKKQLTDERYLKNIEYNLNKKKLLTTQIYVVYPLYLGLEIYCEVAVKDNYKIQREEINRKLNQYIKERPLGAVVLHGEICCIIESIPFVLYIKYLKMEIPMASVKKTGMDNIEIPPNGRVYIKSLMIC